MGQADLAATRGSRGRNQPKRKKGLLEGQTPLSVLYLWEAHGVERPPLTWIKVDQEMPITPAISGKEARERSGGPAGEAPDPLVALSYVASPTS